MVGRHKGLNAFIKANNPGCKFLHCMLRREALVYKKMKSKQSEQNILEIIFLDVVTIKNEIRTRPKLSREFSDFCKDSLTDHNILILHTEGRFLSRGKVLESLISLKDTINDFLVERKSLSAKLFKDLK